MTLLRKALMPLDQDLTLGFYLTLITSMKAPSPNIITLGARASTQGFLRTKSLVHNKPVQEKYYKISTGLLRN